MVQLHLFAWATFADGATLAVYVIGEGDLYVHGRNGDVIPDKMNCHFVVTSARKQSGPFGSEVGLWMLWHRRNLPENAGPEGRLPPSKLAAWAVAISATRG
jgi:hypothetical protein